MKDLDDEEHILLVVDQERRGFVLILLEDYRGGHLRDFVFAHMHIVTIICTMAVYRSVERLGIKRLAG